MRKTLFTILTILIILSMVLTGCHKDKAVSSSEELSKNLAAKVIQKDLQHHGVNVKEVQVNKLTLNAQKDEALVEFELHQGNGAVKKYQTKLHKEDTGWFIEGHKH